jgi:hypothetical protein
MFVALCRWRDAVVAAAMTFRELHPDLGEQFESDEPTTWDRVCELLDDGPWAPPAAQVVGAAAELEIEGRGPYGSADPDRWF